MALLIEGYKGSFPPSQSSFGLKTSIGLAAELPKLSMGATGNTALNWGYDVSSNPNVQYHLPADLLPLSTTVKLGYAPNLNDGAGNSFKNAGPVNALSATAGGDAQHIAVTMTPIDGLGIGADYFDASNSHATAQEFESGNYYAKYAMGNFKVGYNKGYHAPALVAKNGAKTMYENDAYGIEFAVNDALSISYNEEKSEATTNVAIVATKASNTKTKVESEMEVMQVAYIFGGATLGAHIVDVSNADYVSGKDEKMTVFTIAMDF